MDERDVIFCDVGEDGWETIVAAHRDDDGCLVITEFVEIQL